MNLLNFIHQDVPQTPGLLYSSAAIHHQLQPTIQNDIHRDLSDFAEPTQQFQSQKTYCDPKLKDKSRRSTRRNQHILNSYKSRSRSRSRKNNTRDNRTNNDCGVDQLASQLSRINFHGEQIKIRKGPRSCRLQSEPRRQQQPRRTKCIEAGIFKEKMLAKRIIQEKSQPAQVQKPAVSERKDAQQFDFNDPYALIRIDQNMQNDNVACDICLGEDDEEGDEIVICELCYGATHQSCHGGAIKDRLPLLNQPWYCERCDHLLKNNKLKCTEIKCVYCPDIDGIMKPTNNKKSEWAHIVCVNWTPEIWFTDDSKSKISGEVPKSRFDLNCLRCHKNQGSCIQCDFKSCRRSYHVRCAIRGGLIETWDKMQENLGNPQNNMSTPVFCGLHQAEGHQIYKQIGESGLINNFKRSPNRPAFTTLNTKRSIKSLQVKKITKKVISKENKKALHKKPVIKKKKLSRRDRKGKIQSKKEGIHKKEAQIKAAAAQSKTKNMQQNPKLAQMIQDPSFAQQFEDFCQQYNRPQAKLNSTFERKTQRSQKSPAIIRSQSKKSTDQVRQQSRHRGAKAQVGKQIKQITKQEVLPGALMMSQVSPLSIQQQQSGYFGSQLKMNDQMDVQMANFPTQSKPYLPQF